jgi:hypothetical protein
MKTLDQRPEGRKLDCVDPGSFGELAAALFKSEGDQDRIWFSQHPRRRYRLRRMTSNEMIAIGEPPGKNAYCAVRQIEPGARIRLFFSVTNSLQSPIREQQAERFWRWCAGTFIPADALALFDGAQC